ncbi:hypothetical protein BDZ90DRAFT_233131 [Jaminaea rosea]|uniref:Muskelin N-terminal domain-containing protein n=1 Tax=Jaminaea rosea TaxID=1569628 RepID=A0A316UMI8_9BASI|nr:hypothetical protein BDZ90DRAFT_233131 [Jaminaea rosea]PWN26502.1 hypothetical protein BDZ90DRAFT_233131 [Jaminaea rosea]
MSSTPSSATRRPAPTTSTTNPSTLDAFAASKSVPLPYSIAAVSSYSGTYEPSNILTDKPHDLSSRWSGASVAAVASSSATTSAGGVAGAAAAAAAGSSRSANVPAATVGGGAGGAGNGKQYIILKLSQLAVAKSILFGKFHKAHPCNLRDFKVYGGPSPDPNSGLWMRLLRAGLRNDAQPEEFALKWCDADGMPVPIRYIKVVPLAAHSPNYNFSVWHIALKGVCDKALVSRASLEYDEHRESSTMRLMLKHLRSRGHHAAFEALLKSSKLDAPPLDAHQREPTPSLTSSSSGLDHQRPTQRPFEHPIVTQLFQSIMKGDWDAAERCLDISAGQESASSANLNLFARHVSKHAHSAHWQRINATDADGDIPSPRGGHQLIVDSARGTAYLFGGWDGANDLCDLWIYYMAESRWRRISADTREQGGPGPRSCHKMALSSRSGLLYVLGRYVDYSGGPTSSSSTTAGPTTAGAASSSSSSSAGNANIPHRLRAGRYDTRRDAPATSSTSGTVPGSSPDPNGSNSASPNPTHPPAAAAPPSSSPRPTSLQPSATTSNTSPRNTSPYPTYQSDFYRFSTRSERWDLLSRDTAADCGPKLIFDHQMLVDDESQMLYVFGGRVAHWDPAHFELSGLWKWDCIQRTWHFVFDDETRLGDKILSRAGHSMLLDTVKRQLWVLAGQRGETYLADMHVYDLTTKAVREISHDYSQGGKGPEGGFTQRATIDSGKREIYLFSGLVRRSRCSDERVKSAFWQYRMEEDEWRVVWRGQGSAIAGGGSQGGASSGGDVEMDLSEIDDDEDPDGDSTATPGLLSATRKKAKATAAAAAALAASEPRPRYASEMVYDPRTETFLLFGGNPADPSAMPARLDDLWSLKLIRPGVCEALRRAKFTLRQQRFKEMTALGARAAGGDGLAAMEALMYLQTQVAEVVDHDKAHESRTFRKLVAGLLQHNEGGTDANMASLGDDGDATVTRSSSTSDPLNSPISSDGLPSMDTDTGDMDDEMLSISQTLPPRAQHAARRHPDLSRLRPLEAGQRAPALYAQRLELFRELLRFYPPEAIEPSDDVGLAVSAALVRGANRR